MDVCVRLFCVCVVLCVGSGLETGWSPVQGVLPLCKRSRNWKSGEGSTKGCRAIDRYIIGLLSSCFVSYGTDVRPMAGYSEIAASTFTASLISKKGREGGVLKPHSEECSPNSCSFDSPSPSNSATVFCFSFHLMQWPRCLRHEMSSPAPTLGSWVRIPLKAWMSVCFPSVFVLSCVGSGLAIG
jgi:hypothetical protein